MKYTTAITTQSSTFSIDNSHEAWTLADGQTITSSSMGIFEWSDYHENTIVVNGGISAGVVSSAGIDTFGDKTTITVGDTGTISGFNGIHSLGDQFTLVNHGTISGSDGGVIISGDAGTLVNNGTISGSSSLGVDLSGDAGTLINDGLISGGNGGVALSVDTGKLVNNGSISGGGSRGVALSGGIELINNGSISGHSGVAAWGSLDHVHIVNNGTITAAGTGAYLAFDGGNGNETFINHGTLNGTISLWDGNDVFDNRGGSIGNHSVQGGYGNDTFILDSKIAIVENVGEGTDTIKSTITMNLSTGVLAGQEIENLTLLGTKNLVGVGNELDNVIKGNRGNNHLSGAAGDDILTGGKGADIFLFKTGFDHDTVQDFGSGADRIDLSHLTGVTSFADMMAHHVSKSGLDLVIHADTDLLTLEDMSKADLHASDFIF